jgi:2,3-bisphosphoglycerate-independent phosphoglycerate mutase
MLEPRFPDALVERGVDGKKIVLGALIPVSPGIAPGSGPGHLSLFGYDPVEYLIGRGALSAWGVGFGLRAGDLAARLNLATLDAEGRIADRRAGRPADSEARRVVEKAKAGITSPDGVQVFLEHEKEHRAVLILRGEGLEADLGGASSPRPRVGQRVGEERGARGGDP